jgi:cell division protein ZapA (FtsZ GTPase activity inhibitor)
MTKTNVVKVSILGAEFTLRTETTPDQARAIAAYVDDAINDIMQGSARVEGHKAAILAALRIAGELFEARDEASRVSESMRELSEEIRPWLPPAKRRD